MKFLFLAFFLVCGCSSTLVPAGCKKIHISNSGDYILNLNRMSIESRRNWEDLIPVRWNDYGLIFNVLSAHVNYVEAKTPISCRNLESNGLYKEDAILCFGGFEHVPLGLVVRYEKTNNFSEFNEYIYQTKFFIEKVENDLFCSQN